MNLAQGSTTAQSLDRHMPAVSLWALAYMRFPDGSVVKKLPANAGDLGLIPELGRSRGEGNGNPLQYSCLEKSRGQRSLAGYSPCGRKESDTTEMT